MDKKVLFVIATKMQLITALHLININKYKADIICWEYALPNAKQYAKSLSRLGIFHSVRTLSLLVVEDLFFYEYDEVFVTNDVFLYTYQEPILKSKVKVSLFDEGSLSYLERFIGLCHGYCGCRTVYLYEPTLANFYGDKRFIIEQIPKIEANNHVLLQQLNQVFSVDKNKLIGCDTEVLHVFFSQPLQHQLSRKAKVRKFLRLFRNRSKHEYALEKIDRTQEKIIDRLRSIEITLYRKFHPKEKERINKRDTLAIDYPWELYLLNHPDAKVVQYSLFSSVLTSSLVLGESYDVKNYYLYPIVVKELEELGYKDIIDTEVIEYFDRLVEHSKVIPVYSMEELERICQNEV